MIISFTFSVRRTIIIITLIIIHTIIVADSANGTWFGHNIGTGTWSGHTITGSYQWLCLNVFSDGVRPESYSAPHPRLYTRQDSQVCGGLPGYLPYRQSGQFHPGLVFDLWPVQ